MVRSHIAGSHHSRQFSLVACAFVVTLGSGWASQAAAQAVLPSMKYAGAVTFASAEDSRFQLVAGEPELDDCDPLPLARSALSSDTLVLAKAETDKKPGRSARAGKSAATTETLIDAVPMAAAPAAIAVAADATRTWEIIVTDKTLNATMARWAATAGWQLLWELPVDYAVEARTQVRGTFEEAVSIVASSMESAEIPMKAIFYQGNKVLRIMAKGSE
ncbi:toxin co-regulated pilus biosynthesis Q family protein [Herbaspirillum sp. alder98]|uniref:toxin co-regulated pilus biosynthesis Q family protein n=1 Tax=Herbaspirillum sp. alder98 TaxID=2913096 RepID=UPI001CD90D24|nr:toxin co-regulated pilus biosynthesis Q family protein [Herbaspirillum sp. alder98]MCA1325647.1 toxin co-regulated pilus biosynthesis Q family protein [Herbaspirillum sp. alder98]